MTHEELREQAGAFVLGALDPADREQFEVHLTGCLECRADIRSLDRVTEALAYAAPSREPSPQLRTRIVRGIDSGRRPPFASRAVVPWVLAVAASAALVIVTPYTLQLRGETRRLASTVRNLTARLDDRDRQLVAVRSEVSL